MKKKSAYEGLQKEVRKMKMPEIEIWKNQYPDRDYLVTLEFPEFTCVCPRTGLPDFAVIRVRYVPGRWCLELKSLKEYFLSFRTRGIFHEHVVNRIREDLVRRARPRRLEVTGEFNVRGGIKTTVSSEYGRGKGKRQK